MSLALKKVMTSTNWMRFFCHKYLAFECSNMDDKMGPSEVFVNATFEVNDVN